MQIEDRTYYAEEQKMEANWILIFIVFTSISTLVVVIAVLYNSNAPWFQIGMVAGAILFSDLIIVMLFKTMKLELALTKKGLHYKMFPLGSKVNLVDWKEVTAICIRKSPASGYGKRKKYKYGDIYAMNLRTGVELTLTSGMKKFFSLKDPVEFKKGFRKLELNIQIIE